MKRSLFVLALASYLVLASTLLDFSASEQTEAKSVKSDLVVHEWGTFTSIAGRDGVALDWRPLAEKSDLPKFVYTSETRDGWRGSYRDPGKGRLAKVRMETPVIYFYTGREMEVDVRVDFPGGTITEWYPQAGWVNARFESGINWGKIKLLPDEKPNYLREASNSHYYPARETDSVPVQVCNPDKTKIEKEKFLFYRGVGNFDLPLRVKIDGKNLTLAGADGAQLKNLIVFENRGGKIGFRLIDSLTRESIVERPATGQTLDAVYAEFEKILVAEGLYPKEARAMIATWKDSWFEEGVRVFYILPTAATARILPLTVNPQPAETVRVLVGRAEVITPEMERDVRRQVGQLRSGSARAREEAREDLKKYGRFYEPILKSLLESENDVEVKKQIEEIVASR